MNKIQHHVIITSRIIYIYTKRFQYQYGIIYMYVLTLVEYIQFRGFRQRYYVKKIHNNNNKLLL